jgi:hypothetical protein
MRDIIISAALNGYICDVGCRKVVFESRESLLEMLKLYLECPNETETGSVARPIPPCDPPTQQERSELSLEAAQAQFKALMAREAEDHA